MCTQAVAVCTQAVTVCTQAMPNHAGHCALELVAWQGGVRVAERLREAIVTPPPWVPDGAAACSTRRRLRQRPSSAPAPPQRAARHSQGKRLGHWAPHHGLGCSSELPLNSVHGLRTPPPRRRLRLHGVPRPLQRAAVARAPLPPLRRGGLRGVLG